MDCLIVHTISLNTFLTHYITNIKQKILLNKVKKISQLQCKAIILIILINSPL